MQTERTTVIVSVNTEQDEEAQLQKIHQQVGRGWRVVQKVPIEGSTDGPGGNAEPYMRMQVTLERTIDEQNVVVERDDAPGDAGEPQV